MNQPTSKQLDVLAQLIRQVEPTMAIPVKMTREMCAARIEWLLKKKANPAITRKQYMK